MISAIVDGVLLLALVATTVRMVTMHRELRRLGSYHAEYQRIFDQTALALDGIEVSIEEFNVKGTQVLNALGSRMDDARDLIAEIDGLTREAKRQQSVLKAELKELSRATAKQTNPESFKKATTPADEVIFPDGSPARETDDGDTASAQARGNRFLKSELAKTHTENMEVHVPKPTRIHRIEEGAGSPFRSISMSQKDDV